MIKRNKTFAKPGQVIFLNQRSVTAAITSTVVLTIALLSLVFFALKLRNDTYAEAMLAVNELNATKKLREFCMPTTGMIKVTRLPDGSIDCSAEIVGYVK